MEETVLVLASQSPRRRELLELMGLHHFLVRPARGEERAPAGLGPGELVEYLSRQKAREVAGRSRPGELILGADTVVELEGRILGKPHSEEEAVEMLLSLSGRSHRVYTGLTLLRGEVCRTEHEVTLVSFAPLSPQRARAYVATGEPMDKAGAYGIQGRGCVLVEGIRGDYYNVMGLPLCRLGRMLEEFGINCLP